MATSAPSRLERLRERTNDFTVTPRQYALVAYVALGALTLIVLSGAAVRLTGSGLGCPDWPKCYGNAYPPLNAHAVIEFSNRMITVPVSLAAGAAWLLALRRRPYRRDLMWLGALLPLGVIGQAVEKARQEKLIGNALEAAGVLNCDERVAAFWPREELEEFFILSDLTLKSAPEPSATISLTLHKKCARCWRHRAAVGTIVARLELCDRCAAVVEMK